MGEKMGRLNLIVPRWARPEHPVFWLESRRQLRNRSLSTIQGAFLPALFGVVGLTVPAMALFTIPSLYSMDQTEAATTLLLTLEMIVLVCIQLGAGSIVNILTVALAAPLISSEIELQSWRLLRTTMVSLPDVVFAKLAAVLYQLRTMLVGLVVLRVSSSITAVVCFLYIMLRQAIYYLSETQFQDFLMNGEWIPYVILIVAIVVYNLSQPIVQAVMNGMLGLIASSYARSRSQAIAGGLVGRLIIWVATTLSNVGLIFGLSYLFTNWSMPSYAQLGVFRNLPTPTSQQIAWATCLLISGYLLGYLLAQIGFISILTGAVLRRARRLGV